jgi:hypothetical protein
MNEHDELFQSQDEKLAELEAKYQTTDWDRIG